MKECTPIEINKHLTPSTFKIAAAMRSRPQQQLQLPKLQPFLQQARYKGFYQSDTNGSKSCKGKLD